MLTQPGSRGTTAGGGLATGLIVGGGTSKPGRTTVGGGLAPGAGAGIGAGTPAGDMPGGASGSGDMAGAGEGSTTGGADLVTTVPEVAFPGIAVHPLAALK